MKIPGPLVLRVLWALTAAAFLTSCGGGGSGQDPLGSSAARPAGTATGPVALKLAGDKVLVALMPDGAVVVGGSSSQAARDGTKSIQAATQPLGTPLQATKGEEVRLIGYVFYNPNNCEYIEGGSYSQELAPKKGTVTTRIVDVELPESYGICQGRTLPFATAYYTWTSSDTSGYDELTLRFTTTSGGATAVNSWTITLEDNGADLRKNLGRGKTCPKRANQSFPAEAQTYSEASCLKGNPINTANGNKLQTELDFEAAPHTGISHSRFYNSRDKALGPFGVGWRGTWHRGLANPEAGKPVLFAREDGRIETFTPSGNGPSYASDPDIVSVLTLQSGTSGLTGWTLRRPDDSIESYAVDGKLLSSTTRNGKTTTLSYDSLRQLVTVTGPYGHTIRFSYAGGLVASATAPDGGIYRYGYDASKNLTSIAYPDGTTKTYLYENRAYPSALTGIVDELGARYATFAYNDKGRAISTEHAGGAEKISVAYNADGTSTITDARGASHTLSFVVKNGLALPAASDGVPDPTIGGRAFSYSDSGYVIASTDWNGNQTTRTFDARGNETSRTEAAGFPAARTTTTTWSTNFSLPIAVSFPTKQVNVTRDAKGNPTTITESASGQIRTTVNTFNSTGQLLTQRDPRGNTTRFEYDARGNLSAWTNPLGHRTSFTAYDANGRPMSIIDPNGVVTTMAYDARGRLVSRITAGEVTQFRYDAAGNQIAVTKPDGSRLVMEYDAAHRLISITDSLGNRIRFTLDANGNKTAVEVFDASSALNRIVRYEYDPVNRLIAIKGARGQTTQMVRDNNGNVTRLVDPVGATTQSEFDALDRMVKSIDALGGTTAMTYDGADRLLSLVDPRGLVTSYVRNGFGDVLVQTSPDSGVTRRTVDANGNVLTSTDARGATTANSFDPLNRLTASFFSLGAQNYRYDLGRNGIGRLSRVSGPADFTDLTYDPLGRVTRKAQTVGGVSLSKAYAYNPGGTVSEILYPSGMRVGYEYDAAAQVVAVIVNGTRAVTDVKHEPFGPAKNWTWLGESYSRAHDTDGRVSSYPLGPVARTVVYDNAGRVTRFNDSNGDIQTFGYDPLWRLAEFAGLGVTQKYGYDAGGNRTSLISNGRVNNYGIDAGSNRLLNTSATSLANEYDAAGNLTRSGNANYVVDGRGRMTLAYSFSPVLSYGYYTTSGLGERVQKITRTGATTFMYGDGGRLYGEYGAGRLQETIYLDGQPIGLNGNGQVLRIYADHLGTPRLIRSTNGSTLWSWNSEPFGNTTPVAALQFNQRFPGQYFDIETGLNYNMARYYSPVNGRYTQSDPIGLTGGPNSFAYVGGDPIGRSDRLGLISGKEKFYHAFRSACFALHICTTFPMDPPNLPPDNTEISGVPAPKMEYPSPGRDKENVRLCPEPDRTEPEIPQPPLPRLPAFPKDFSPVLIVPPNVIDHYFDMFFPPEEGLTF